MGMASAMIMVMRRTSFIVVLIEMASDDSHCYGNGHGVGHDYGNEDGVTHCYANCVGHDYDDVTHCYANGDGVAMFMIIAMTALNAMQMSIVSAMLW